MFENVGTVFRAFKVCTKCYYNPKKFCKTNIKIGLSKNVEFLVDFKYVDAVLKKCPQKANFCQYLSFSVCFPWSLKPWSPLLYKECYGSTFLGHSLYFSQLTLAFVFTVNRPFLSLIYFKFPTLKPVDFRRSRSGSVRRSRGRGSPERRTTRVVRRVPSRSRSRPRRTSRHTRSRSRERRRSRSRSRSPSRR